MSITLARTAPAPPTPQSWWRPAGRRLGLVVLALVPFLVLVVLFCYPVATLISKGLITDGRLDLVSAWETVRRPRLAKVVAFTVEQAAASAALCLILGLPAAFLLSCRRFPGRAAIRVLLTVPFVLPTVVIGLAFRTLLASSGPLGSWGWDGSVAAILAAHVTLNLAVVVRTVGAAWAQLDRRPAQAAATLGAGPIKVALTVTLPALGPAIAAAAVLVFLFCATSFGVVLILGQGRYNTVETEIYRQTTELLDLRTASVLSIVQLLLVAATLAVGGWLGRRSEVGLRPVPARPTRLSVRDMPAALITAAAGVLVLGPLLTLAIRSLRTENGWGLDNYRALGQLGDGNVLYVPVIDSIWISIRTAVVAAAIAMTLGLCLAVVLARRPPSSWARRGLALVDVVVLLPLGVSAVTVGFGFLIALDKPPLDLRGSALLVPLAQALVVTPLVVRMVLPALRGLDDRLRQAAAVSGAGPVRVWLTTDLPLAARALAAATGFALAMALGEFGATAFLARPQSPTLPVVIARLIDRPGVTNTGMALAASCVLAALCVLLILAVDLALRDRRGPGVVAGRAGLGL